MNPKSDAGRIAIPSGKAVISPGWTWDTGMKKSSGE
jgi:hypothetical protein